MEIVDWLLSPMPVADRELFTSWQEVEGEHGKTLRKSFDCSIMDLADDIAFGVHDLEDALSIGLMNADDLAETLPERSCASFLDYMQTRENVGNDVHGAFIKALADEATRKRNIGRMVTHLITSVQIEIEEGFETPLLRDCAALPEAQAMFLKALKKAVRKKVIKSANVQQLEFKSQSTVVAVFEALATDPMSLLPESTRKRYEAADDKMRVICDHVSGMTDTFLLRTFDRLFSPRMGSIFDQV